jgi:ATP-binding protein involved in chromosome partitioning
VPTQAQVLDAIGGVDDPVLERPFVELGMVDGVGIVGGSVTVRIKLPAAPVPAHDAAVQRIREALAPLPDVERVDVDLIGMDDADLEALGRRLLPPREGGRSNPFDDARTRVLAVSSGKGGVGKSSVTTNLAVALAQRGKRVAAIDADVWGFSMPRMLGVQRGPGVIGDVIVPPVSYGVKLISMGFFAPEDEAVIWRGPMLHKALEQFLTDVYWGVPDYLIIDMPPGTGDVAISMAGFLPRAEVLVVTTPQPAAQSVAQRAAFMAKKVRLPILGIIENMSWFRGDDGKAYELFGSGGGAELAAELEVPLLAQIPLVPALREGGDEGRPIVVAEPDGEAAQTFAALAQKIDVELAPRRIFRPELRIT